MEITPLNSVKTVFIGPPNSGKGTLGRIVRDNLGFDYFSMGDMLRNCSKGNTEFEIFVRKTFLEQHHLVPDSIVTKLVADALDSINGNSVVLDGYPRNTPQAEALDDILAGDYFPILINVEDSELLKRAEGRVSCQGCGQSYNLNSRPPINPGFCDSCNAGLVRRKEDKQDIALARLQGYKNYIEPNLVEHYGARMISIDGNAEPLKVFELFLEAITNHNN